MAAAVFHYFKDDGEADAVAFYLGGHCCECRTAFVFLVSEIVEPVCIFVHCFFGQTNDLRFSFVWDFEDLADYITPGVRDILGDFIVVELWVVHLVWVSKEPSVHESAVDLAFGKFVQESGLYGADDSYAGVIYVDGFAGYAVDYDVAAGEELCPHLFVVAIAVFVEAFDESDELIYIYCQAPGVDLVLSDEDFCGEVAEDGLDIFRFLELRFRSFRGLCIWAS